MRPLSAWLVLGLFAVSAPAWGQEYLPLAKGNTWTYDAETFTGAAGFGVRATTTVTAKVTDLTNGYHVIRWTDGLGKLDVSIQAQASGGVIRVGRSSGRNLFLLPAHLSGGRAHVKVVIDGEAIELDSLKVGKKTSVTVPAGTYQAFPVTNSVTLPGVVIKTSVWYAAGTGPVKVEELVTTGGTATVKRTLKLKAFTRGSGAAAPTPAPARPETGKKTGDAPRDTSRDPRTTKKPGQLTKLVAGLIKNGRSTKALGQLKALVQAVLKRAGSDARIPAALTVMFDAPLGQRHKTGTLEADGNLKELLLIAKTIECAGSINNAVVITRGLECEGTLKNSLVIVDGNIEVTGYMKDCLVLCTGRVQGDAYIKSNLIVTLGTVHADAYLKDNVIEAKQGASADAYSKNNLFLSTRLKAGTTSKRDTHTSRSKLPSALLGKRAKGDR